MGTTTTPNLGLIKPDGNEPASNWPTQVGANMDTLDGRFYTPQSYTPVLSSGNVGSTGHLNGWFLTLDKLVHFWIDLEYGGTGVDGGGSSTIIISLPFDQDTSIFGSVTFGGPSIGGGLMRDSATQSYPVAVTCFTTGNLIMTPHGSNAFATGVSPFTIADGDTILLHGTYARA